MRDLKTKLFLYIILKIFTIYHILVYYLIFLASGYLKRPPTSELPYCIASYDFAYPRYANIIICSLIYLAGKISNERSIFVLLLLLLLLSFIIIN
jgi:hypothetical protein